MNADSKFRVRVIEDYQAPYPDPIQVKAGDEVDMDRSKETDIAGWVWCTNRLGKSGWVPNSYIKIVRDRCKMVHDYSAIELTIHVGDILTVHKEESGFYWAASQSRHQGWIPIANVETLEENL